MQLFDDLTDDTATTGTDDWYTPPELFTTIGVRFDIDVCAPVNPTHRTVPANRYLTVLDDGLTTPWDGLVWCNPPYSKAAPWVEKWAAHPEGLLLTPALPEVGWWGRLGAADAVTLISLYFLRPNGGPRIRLRWSLILAARGARAVECVKRAATADPYAGGAYWTHP